MQEERPAAHGHEHNDISNTIANVMDQPDGKEQNALRQTINHRQTRITMHPMHRRNMKRFGASGIELESDMEGALMKVRADRAKRDRAVTLLQVRWRFRHGLLIDYLKAKEEYVREERDLQVATDALAMTHSSTTTAHHHDTSTSTSDDDGGLGVRLVSEEESAGTDAAVYEVDVCGEGSNKVKVRMGMGVRTLDLSYVASRLVDTTQRSSSSSNANIPPAHKLTVAQAARLLQLTLTRMGKPLTHITITGNRLGRSIRVSMAEVIQLHPALVSMWCGGNDMGDDGICAISDALCERARVTEAYWQEASRGDGDGASEFIQEYQYVEKVPPSPLLAYDLLVHNSRW